MEVSIVHEYSILYSDRLVQKDKKWVDGFLRYYEFNNKVEILNEDEQLVKGDFKNISFEVGKQYVINKMLVDIIDFNGTSERYISVLLKKEPVSGDSPSVSNSIKQESIPTTIRRSPSMSSLPKPPAIKIQQRSLGLTKTKSITHVPKSGGPSVLSKRKTLIGLQQMSAKSPGLKRPTSPVSKDAKLKFPVVEPIAGRILPRSSIIYKFMD
ncbi:hypothetical protein PSN45_002965 [Yamadazyma tenuis]|uniref:5'-3' DNA helicase ZGRF1-like N-terminal domain-containing protein n=1 Tax=Candida tenuis (strain ATCC 10573 / BCRC 21748 / CBS 615 / JCM 9827 / NBRC 10315 / NRRL Y-1498 / VKM Y-70) TaxID=590646 RepID=G3AW29_CANTC|nr:uncharacterized protein CANTEDRAFT_112172 [Yamadazyma tenuis ATCC 10573]EGV66435.1 hypothetical protein CANTEDRAFT_112172 [Yamadazyma tenuis ATCC 10573]WEJ95446.1 hypothetical protein PSN45_002965 [Yamadazyma tenuis]